MGKLLADGSIADCELQVRCKGGAILDGLLSGEVISSQGKRFLLTVMLDITERKRMEEKLREANRSLEDAIKQAELANVAKTRFLSNMSHEIRTPMNAILGFAQILERDSSLTPRQAKQIGMITTSGSHLLNLINDILDMSKIEAGRATLNPTSFWLPDFLADLERMFLSRTVEKGMRLAVKLDDSASRFVTADEGKLRQVMVNLIGNAVKYTEAGVVAVRVSAETLEAQTVPDKVDLRLVVEVEDTGPGIPDEEIDQIFDAFKQVDVGVKAGGTGLGLAITRKLVEMMGGEITVASRVGRGSCFRFDVRVSPSDGGEILMKPAQRRVVGLEPGQGPFRILVVDDVDNNRTLLRELLDHAGFEVSEASNGVEAVEVFEFWSPHAVLMDMRMPLMDGYEASRRIKSTEAGRRTPIIGVTASAFDESMRQVLATGLDACLTKPFQPEELFETLGKCLGLRYVFAKGRGTFPGRPKLRPGAPDALAALPAELVRAMRQAVEQGDMARMAELFGEVDTVDTGAARMLKDLAEEYDYENLIRWFDRGGDYNEC